MSGMNRNMGVKEAVREYAKQLAEIYDKRLAGDYTFQGVLYEFLVAVNGWVVKPTDETLLEESEETIGPKDVRVAENVVRLYVDLDLVQPEFVVQKGKELYEFDLESLVKAIVHPNDSTRSMDAPR